VEKLMAAGPKTPKSGYYDYRKEAIGLLVGRDCIVLEFVGFLLTIPSLQIPWRIQQGSGPKTPKKGERGVNHSML
jgi:hypothetical protein